MNLSDPGRPTATPRPDAPSVERLHTLLAQVGAEIAGPLTAALERVNTLASTGRIEAESLRRLREEVEAARQAGVIGQQLTRFTSGRIRQSHERLQLAETVAHLLSHRQREVHAHGVTLRQTLAPVEVIVDAALLFGLVNASVDWALANLGAVADARANSTATGSTTAASAPPALLEIGVEPLPAPGLARIACRFAQPVDADGVAAAPADSLTWRLIEQTAWAMGACIERRQEAARVVVTFDFPRLLDRDTQVERALDANDGFPASMNSQPLAGSHLLVIASRRDLRVQVRDALRHMSLIIDFVNSVDEAAVFCREGLPHAIVIEAIQSGERFARLRRDICAEVHDFVFIEIVEEGRAFEMSGAGGQPARVGRGVLAESLPAALMFELSKSR